MATNAERAETFRAEQSREWEIYQERIAKASTFIEAELVSKTTPGVDRPGRRFYTNLMHFLMTFELPYDSSLDERMIYLRLIQRMSTDPVLKPGAATQVEAKLKAALPGVS